MRLSSRNQSCTRRLSQGTTTGRAIELGGGAAGMGDQRQQALEQQHPVTSGVLISQAELTREALQQILD